LSEDRGKENFCPEGASIARKNRKAIFRLAGIFDAERGPFLGKKQRF